MTFGAFIPTFAFDDNNQKHNTMKKTFLMLFTALFAVYSCGGDDETETTAPEPQPNTGASVKLCPDDNHPHAIDMGECGVWSCCNVGASKPEEYGSYFAWGDIAPKSSFEWSTYTWGTNYDQLTKYCSQGSWGHEHFTDGKQELDAEDDAATADRHAPWRMPSEAQFNKLMSACNPLWTRINNVYGILFTASNNNRIFLPGAGYAEASSIYEAGIHGYYWSRTRCASLSFYAVNLDCSTSEIKCNTNSRYQGHTIRPRKE